MKTSLDHLPPNKQDRVRAIARLIREAAPVEMIILYGSFARGGWVDDPAGGYVSDYDLAIITKNHRLASNPDLWGNIERNAQRLAGRASVSFIVHDIRELNHHLRSGHCFFTDLVKEGVLLHDAGRFKLARPRQSTPAERLSHARACLREYFEEANRRYQFFEFGLQKEWHKAAAFELHQATELYYKTAIMVFTSYRPKEHNLAILGKQCAELHADLGDVFPTRPKATATATTDEERRFELLKQAYVDARYSMSYRITREDLEWLAARVRDPRARVERVCTERIAAMDAPEAAPEAADNP